MLDEHLGYVSDGIRLDRFRAAIAELVRPGDRVADLGCGSGILGLLCLQAGASRVFAIDGSSMIEVARQTFARAGLADRVAVIRGLSQRVELPERVDVVICDHVGAFGFDYGIVHTLQDARRRFLKPGGRVVPARIRLQLGAVEAKACHDKVEGWGVADVPAQYHWLRQASVNSKHAAKLTRVNLLSSPAPIADIDLHADNPDFFTWKAELSIARDGVMHGLAGWFECELAHGVCMTNSPLSERSINREQAFLPIEEPVAVKSGDRVEARIMARPAENLLAWSVDFPAIGRRFKHSSWNGLLLAANDLARSRPGRVPTLSREGRARLAILGYCDGRHTASEIEQSMLRDHCDLFPTRDEISRFVTHVLHRDTE